jgi:hypothetical protein
VSELQSSARCVFVWWFLFGILTENSNRKNNKLELNASISMRTKPLGVISCFDWVKPKSFSHSKLVWHRKTDLN